MQQIPVLRSMSEQAHYLMDHDDFTGAENELTKLIEVSAYLINL